MLVFIGDPTTCRSKSFEQISRRQPSLIFFLTLGRLVWPCGPGLGRSSYCKEWPPSHYVSLCCHVAVFGALRHVLITATTVHRPVTFIRPELKAFRQPRRLSPSTPIQD